MMDFLKKAKKTMKDLETDLNKATAALGLNNNAPQDTSTDQYTVQDNFQFSSDNSQYTAQDNIQYTTQDTARDTAQDTSPGNSQSIDQYGSQFMAAASKVQNGSARSTPASTAMNTPATSVAPSSVGGVMRAKLPLAVRKSRMQPTSSFLSHHAKLLLIEVLRSPRRLGVKQTNVRGRDFRSPGHSMDRSNRL